MNNLSYLTFLYGNWLSTNSSRMSTESATFNVTKYVLCLTCCLSFVPKNQQQQQTYFWTLLLGNRASWYHIQTKYPWLPHCQSRYSSLILSAFSYEA